MQCRRLIGFWLGCLVWGSLGSGLVCGRAGSGAGVAVEGGSEGESSSAARAHAHYAAAIAAETTGDSAAAMTHMEAAALEDPGESSLVLEAVRRLLAGQQPERALTVLDRAIRMPGSAPSLLAWNGLTLAAVGRTNEARRAHQTALRRDPSLILAYQGLVQLLLPEGRKRSVVSLLRQARRQKTDDPAFWLQVADMHLAVLQAEGATNLNAQVRVELERVLDRVEAATNRSPVVLQRLAEQWRLAGNYARSESLYTNLLSRFPNPILRERLVDVYLRMGRTEEARIQLETLKREFPTNPQLYYMLGAIAADERRFKDAAELFQDALRLKPDFEQVYYDLAGVQISMDAAADALSLLGRAREQFKPGFLLEFYTGLALSRLKRFDDAVKHFDAASEAAAKSEPARLGPTFYFQAGAARERAGDHAGAEKQFRRALELNPEFAEALNYLGYMWADLGVNLAEARKLIEKAVKMQPENAAFLDSLGWVLYREGRVREALPWLEKAVEKSEEPDPTLYDHLGDVYRALGNSDRAREAWNKSLGIESNTGIEKKLRELTPPVAR